MTFLHSSKLSHRSDENKRRWIFWLLLVSTAIAIYGPRFYSEGLFSDGVTYACIARNMAMGKGAFWAPYFSSSFWLDYNQTAVFYEHPPLMFWLQSWLFKLFGDVIYVEKIYSLLVFLLSGWLIVLFWNLVFRKEYAMRFYSWVPIMVWISMPEVEWSTPNNLLDNTMGLFSGFAVYFLARASTAKLGLHSVLGGVCIVAAFLTKGPVGLFPLAVPAVLWVLDPNYAASKLLKQYFYMLVPLVLVVVCILILPEARNFMGVYLQQQVFNALLGQREVTVQTSKWAFIFTIMDQIRNGVALALLLWLLSLLIKSSQPRLVNSPLLYWVLFFLYIALSASLPILISSKQAGYYMVPSTYFYAVSIGLIIAFWLRYLSFDNLLPKTWLTSVLILMCLICAGVNVFALQFISKKRAYEADLKSDMVYLTKYTDQSLKVVAAPRVMNDFNVHANLNRYYRIELTDSINNAPVAFCERNSDKEFIRKLLRNGYVLQREPLRAYQIFYKKP